MKLSDLKKLSRHLTHTEDRHDPVRMQQALREMGYDPAKLYQELEMSSFLADAHRDETSSNQLVNLHSHNFYEILYCRTSCGAEYFIGADRYRLQRGDVIFVPPGISHRPLLPETISQPYKRYVLWLSPEFAEQYGRLYPSAKSWFRHHAGVLRTADTPWEDMIRLFRTAVGEAEAQRDGWEAAVAGCAMILLPLLKRAMEESATHPMPVEKPELLDRLVAYIEENYHRRITLSDVAQRFFVSTSTVSHLFQEKMGTSFYRCVTQRRLIAAKVLILRGESMDSVSEQVGFSDYSAFYRAFKREYGISPHQFRRTQ